MERGMYYRRSLGIITGYRFLAIEHFSHGYMLQIYGNLFLCVILILFLYIFLYICVMMKGLIIVIEF